MIQASIIIPCFNMAEFLPRSIESALAQTVEEKEVIVVDDGSRDNTLAVAHRYPVKVIHQGNKGLAGARNAAIMNSSGRAILPLDADDWIESTYLQETLPFLEKEGVGIVTTDWSMFGIHTKDVRTPDVTLRMIMEANHIPVCSLIRRSAVLGVGGYNPQPNVYEDWQLWIELMKVGWEAVTLHKTLFHYCTRPNSLVSKSNGHHAELFGRIMDLHPEIYRAC